jgi:predicted GNAT family acetyltransferase
VYTPAEQRRQGCARQAVAKLCLQLREQYEHISLLVSDRNHTAIRVYQDIGFVDAGVLVVADKPGYCFGYPVPQQQAGATDAEGT